MCRCLEPTCYAKCRKTQAQVALLWRLPLRITRRFALDDWLLKETKPEAVDELFAVVDARARARKSTVVCAQYRVEGWPSRMGDYPAAESIVDRLKNNAYVIELKGEVSMRERCMDEELRAYAERQKKG